MEKEEGARIISCQVRARNATLFHGNVTFFFHEGGSLMGDLGDETVFVYRLREGEFVTFKHEKNSLEVQIDE